DAFADQPLIGEQEGAARQVSVVPQHADGVPDVMAGEAEIDTDRVDDLLAAGMEQPVTDIAAPHPCFGQQTADDELCVSTYHVRNLRIEEKAELSRSTVPVVTHGIKRVGDEVTGERQDPRPASVAGGWRRQIGGLTAA